MSANHLIREKSPYLLQHAHNPVDWYPWGPEAFARAREEGKPIFLSIGYSTCHWCHVMEQESFEDEEVAALLNRDYISIKVDREERPDVDGVYMKVCQMMNGSGGWPLTILMTAEQKPFFAGTYLPKKDRYGQLGLMGLLSQVSGLWKREASRLSMAAEDVVRELNRQEKAETSGGPARGAVLGNPLLLAGARQLEQMYDGRWGGFGSAPKFPVPHNLLFLLKMYEGAAISDASSGQSSACAKEEASGQSSACANEEAVASQRWLAMAETTLQQMYRGGLFDHIGGGFSRYSTDEAWLVPHFEKMLYDNALLALAYGEAWRITRDELYLQVLQRTLRYLMRELGHEKGGFYCGQDADSEGQEGKYYVFSPAEIKAVLGEQDGAAFCAWYDITREGNFEGKSIPNLLHNQRYREVPEHLEKQRILLYEYRKERTKLHRDDKLLTSWNGFAIWAFARAYQITGSVVCYRQARAAAAFLRANLMTQNGRLRVRWRGEEAAFEGNLDDYAFFAMALYELYQCDFNESWLRTCIRLTEKMLEFFKDETGGGFFFSGTHGETLISRPKETYDGAVPSGNAVAGLLLVRLSRLTGELRFREAARAQLDFLQGAMEGYPAGHTMALLAIWEWEHPGIHLVCTAGQEVPDEEIRCYRKGKSAAVDALVITPENQKSLTRLIPQAGDFPLKENKNTFYVCEGEHCQPPVEELL